MLFDEANFLGGRLEATEVPSLLGLGVTLYAFQS